MEEETGGKVFSAALGHDLVFVDREQLRRTSGYRMVFPTVQGLVGAPLPAPPATVDWTKNNSLNLPILGNDRYGDCFYCAVVHAVQVWTGSVGTEAQFSSSDVVRRYLQLSPRDGGLSDEQVFPEWKAGVIGPNGPHKILDDMIVTPTDRATAKLAAYLFGGLIYTAALSSSWKNNIGPGVTWDVGRPNRNLGHAMFISGVDAGTYKVQTWGLNPPVNLTFAGLESCDPELVACFSLDWFDPKTGLAPNGYHYDELAAFWAQLGGKPLPPSPFPPKPAPQPAPPLPPAPAPTSAFTLSFAVDPVTSTITVTPPAGYAVVADTEPPDARP